MLNLLLDRTGRSISALLFLFWGAFFIEHLFEWFLRSDGQFPPPMVWIAQTLHFGMLAALAWSIFKPLPGSLAILLTTAAFFGYIHAFPTIAIVNLVPVVIALINCVLKSPARGAI